MGADDTVSYTVEVDGADLGSGEVGCDGSVMVNSLGPINAGARVDVALALSGAHMTETAYVIVAPAP